MRVLFDISSVRHGILNGTAVYAYRLAKALLSLKDGPELLLYFGARPSDEAECVLSNLESIGGKVVRSPGPWRWSPDGAWWLPIQPPLRKYLEAVDVFHLGEFHLPRGISTPTVATIHDLTTILFPEQHTRLNRLVHARRLRWVARNASQIIAISNCTQKDFVARYRVGESRINVVYHARGQGDEASHEGGLADLSRVRATYALGDTPYILSVGTIEPRKNHVRLLSAFEALSDRFQNVHLVLVGGLGWHSAPIVQRLKKSPVRDRVHYLGPVPEADLIALYGGATVFAFPSLYEGFGLPLLEAMAAGAPVLTSQVSSLPEVAGDAAVLVDPLSVDSIRLGLEQMLHDDSLRARLSARGKERDREFTWRRTAEQTVAVYRRAVERQ